MKIFNCALGLALVATAAAAGPSGTIAGVAAAHGPGNFTNVLNFGDSWAWLGKGELKKALYEENKNLREEAARESQRAGLRYFCARCQATADTVLLPCRHLACCSNCVDFIDGRCPCCAEQVESSLRIYIP